jgi:hypothetical protein
LGHGDDVRQYVRTQPLVKKSGPQPFDSGYYDGQRSQQRHGHQQPRMVVGYRKPELHSQLGAYVPADHFRGGSPRLQNAAIWQ